MMEDAFQGKGLNQEEARLAAKRAFGGVDQAKERHRDARSFRWLTDARADLRYALRGFAKAPGVPLVALVTLAVGIGANTGIVSAVNAVLLTPPPYPAADRLVAIWERLPTGELNAMTTRNYLAYANQPTVFERVAATTMCCGGVTLTQNGTPVFLGVFRVGSSYFDMLGATAAIGRTFVAGDDQPGQDHVVVVSHALWVDQFGSDAALIGRSIRLDGEPYTVIGVMPANGPFARFGAQVWLPLAFGADRLRRTDHWLLSRTGAALGLLKPGVTLQRARAEMNVVSARLAVTYPDTNTGWGVAVEPLAAVIERDVRPSLYLLLAAVALALLLACVNLANMLLARGIAREQELAIRVALGAGRGRIVRQFLTEAILLSVSGGVLGIGLAYVFLPTLTGMLPPQTLPPEALVTIDTRVLLFAATLSVVVGLVCGVAPAVWATRTTRMSTDGHRRASNRDGYRRVRAVLVVVEIALASLLLSGASLLMHSFFNMWYADAGFQTTNLLTGYLPIRDTRFSSPEQLTVYLRQIDDRIRAVPGIEDVAFSDGLPFQGVPSGMLFQVQGHPVVDRARRPICFFKVVSAPYFRELGLRVRQGRGLGERDGSGSSYVTVINETMARRYFPGENPVGQHLLMQLTRPGTNEEISWEIVGVIANEQLLPFADKRDLGAVYVPLEQSVRTTVTGHPNLPSAIGMIVHTTMDPTRAQASVRHAVFTVDKDQSLIEVKTVDQLKSESMAAERLRSTLVSLFAMMAVFLAAIGLYGVLAYTVVQRTHELGIRAALGASPAQQLELILRRGLTLTGAGLLLGLAAALGLGRLLAAFLFRVEPSDPTTLVETMSLLAGVAVLACYIPARRAAKIDPAVALRSE
jgi:putative ABC transport system permease protein